MGLLFRKPLTPTLLLLSSCYLLFWLFNPLGPSIDIEGHFKRESIPIQSFFARFRVVQDKETPLTVRPDSQDGSDGAFSGDLDGPSAEATAEDAWLGPDERRRLKEYRLSTARSKEESPRMKRIRALYSLRTEADWLKFIEEGNSDGMAPFTKFAQKYIYEHQHPKNCEGKRLLVMRKFPVDESFGIGAIAQAVGVNLAMALMTGRILVYDTPSPGSRFISDPTSSTCGASWDCIFHKISSCKAPPRVKPPSPKPGDPLAPLIFADDAPVVYLPAEQGTPALYFRTPSSTIPPLLHKLLRKMDPHITEAKMKYWWRAQAAAYVMRPNAVAMERLKTLRTDTSLNRGLIVTEEGSTAVDMPFPLPDGSWSMHVRHGDKGIEMGLVPFLQYASAAERYISENPLSSQKIAFISTEDSEVVELAKKTSRVLSNKLPSAQDGWTWYWSEIQRLNASPEDQLVASGNRTEMTLNWVFQLLTAVEADGFVGTKGSGWNRLIDQLRCVWIANCKAPFFEVGEEKSWVRVPDEPEFAVSWNDC